MNNLIQKVGLKWGLIVAAVSVAFSIIQMSTIGVSVELSLANSLMGLMGFVITIGGAILTMRDYKSQNDGYMTLGEGFKTGMVMFAVSSIISSIYNFINFKFLNPELPEEMLNATMEALENTPNMQEEMLEMMEGFYSVLTSANFQLIGGILGGLLFGAIIAVIVAAIMKKDPPLEV